MSVLQKLTTNCLYYTQYTGQKQIDIENKGPRADKVSFVDRELKRATGALPDVKKFINLLCL